MTLPQVGLLAGLIVVFLVILALGLKYVVYAPPKGPVVPTVTPVDLASLLGPTLEPTPVPDYTTAVLTIDEMPDTFRGGRGAGSINFNEFFEGVDLSPASSSTLFEVEKKQTVVGWTFAYTTSLDRDNFNAFVAYPDPLFDAYRKRWDESVLTEWAELENPIQIGGLSSGWKVVTLGPDIYMRMDVVLFSRVGFGGMVVILNDSDQAPVVGAWEAARKLDARIQDVLAHGPIPISVVVAYQDLSGLKLNQEDLPPGFEIITDTALALDEASLLVMDGAKLRIAEMFGFYYGKTNAEETVLGYTYLFTETRSKSAMDIIMTNDLLLSALYPPGRGLAWQRMTGTRPIGDLAQGSILIGLGENGDTRCDAILFHRGYVGVALFHVYHTGVWKTSVQDLALKLDAKLQALASP